MGVIYSLLAWWSLGLLWAQIDVDRVVKIGLNAMQFRDYVVAIEHFNQVVDTAPDKSEPYYLRAFAKLMLGDYLGAEEDATKALQRNPFISRAYLVRGVALQSQQKNMQAAKDYVKALEILPDDIETAFNLSGALYAGKQYQKADSVAQALLARNPQYHRAHVLRAEIALAQKDTVAAEKIVTSLLTQDSLATAPHRILAMIEYQRGNYSLAIKHFDQALAIDDAELSDYINRGLSHFKNNNLKAALEDYDQAVLLSPMETTARYNRAILRHYVGDLNGALEDFLAVASVQPHNMVVRYNIALLRHQSGLYQEALADYNMLLDRYPGFVDGYYQRAQLKEQMGDRRGADKDYWYAYDIENKRITPPAPKQKDPTGKDYKKGLEDLANYNSLLEGAQQSQNTQMAAQQSSIRGSIQDQETSTEAYGDYALSYFASSGSKLLPKNHYSADLEAYNLRNKEYARMLLSTEKHALDSAQVRLVVYDLQQAMGVEPLTPDLLFRIGVDYLLLRDYAKSLEYLGRCLDLNNSFFLAYMARSKARILQHESQYASAAETVSPLTKKSIVPPLLNLALEDLKKALALAPSNGYLYHNCAVIYARMGNTEQAIQNYNKAIELLTYPAFSYYNRGLLLLEIGKPQEAVADLSRAGELGIYKVYSLIKKIHQVQARTSTP